MIDTEALARLSNSFTSEKRFETDYEIMEIIGKGGFSTVYKVRSLLDNNLYAVKQIQLKTGNFLNKISMFNEIDKVLKEIRILARIKSDYVVNYNHSWVEVKLNNELNHSIDNNTIDDSIVIDYEENNLNNLISFQSNSQSNQLKSLSKEMKKDLFPTKSIHENNNNDKVKLNGKYYSIAEISLLTIYIQMQLCEETLNDYIKRQFVSYNKIVKNSEKQLDYPQILNLFLEIVKSVEYIHSQNIIHRDLKPKNIIVNDGNIKLVDFGLATNKSIKKQISCDGFNTGLANKDLKSIDNIQFYTKNLGTPLYSAPEQLSNCNYDDKVDVYPLGLILFELSYPMKTKMEKIETLKNLRKGIFPEAIKENSIIYQLISKILNNNPKQRPTSGELKRTIEELLNNFLDHKLINKKRKMQRKNNNILEEISKNKIHEVVLKTDDNRSQNKKSIH